MRKYSLFLLLFLSLHFSAQVITETQKLESLCRIWGFLKYYHPHVAKGNINWDKQLFQKINELEHIHNKQSLNTLYSDWITNLGEVPLCKECSVKDHKVYFLKNFDLRWIDNSQIFSDDVSQKLRYIEKNRNLGDNHYVGKGGRKIYFRNEKSYGSEFTSKTISLLELFRYWNYVEYFFPYKYETDQNWNDVLSEMIPKFLMIDNDENFHLTLAELVTKTDDSHAFISSKEIQLHQYGKRKVPVEYSYAEGKLVVIKINNTRSRNSSPLHTGDIIYDIDGKTIPQMINNLGKYVPASNSWGKVSKIKDKLLFSNNDSISVKIEREGQNLEIKAKTYLVKDIFHEKIVAPQKWKFIDDEKKTGYVNMGMIEKEDLDEMYRELKSTKSIIFDIRNYPKQTIIPLSYLLLPEPTVYYQFTFPDTSYPGKFYSRKNVTGRKNPEYYKGNVIVLVDENTQSQAETTTMMFKQHPKAKIIGSNTSGANGDVVMFKIADLDTRFTGLGAYYPDGRETQRIGIIPDILVKPSVEGLKNGKDEVLEKALEYIETIP
ncbi:C-terminal processing protease CtpA/Prc [Chryseobacterium sp. PvR013]|uniref:S41 family peptidase n=1 Tax=Chryseobacterium sp. PvR013 TaxID=2806595 RepID=UPI001AE629E4|nr:S41 family peptidase [Chryseobacterium sp. PvR013]MBP1167571.1 C-terminal processing protease CtpA/Prc [Chryseobacterium sp. PvR013]